MPPNRRLKRKLPFILFLAGCFLLFAGALLVAGELWLKLTGNALNLNSDRNTDEAGEKLNSMTVLLLGVDARPQETVARTDTIIVAHVEAEANRLCLLSIPRDTRVNIPGHGMDKINAANVYGGPELVRRVVSDLIGMPVKYYALTNWEGFKDIVDTLGGVTIEVEKPMQYYDPVDGPEYAIDLKPGVQRLDGRKALQYVRYRNDALGDIARTERQLKFLKALAREVMQAQTILKLPRLVPQISKSLQTNLGLSQMITLARVAKNFEQMEIVTQVLPGYFLEQGGVSYWAVNSQQAKKVALSLFKDGQVTQVVAGPTVKEGPGTTKALALKTPEKQPEASENAGAALKTASSNSPPKTSASGVGTGSEAGSEKAKEAAGGEKKNSGSAPDPKTPPGQAAGNLEAIPAPKENAQNTGGGAGKKAVPEKPDQDKPTSQAVSVEIIFD